MSSFPETAIMQTRTDHRALVEERTILMTSKEKSKVMRNNNKQREKIQLKDVELEEVQRFTYLVSIKQKTNKF